MRSDGTVGDDCSKWGNRASGVAIVGSLGAIDAQWTNMGTSSCAGNYPLICFEL